MKWAQGSDRSHFVMRAPSASPVSPNRSAQGSRIGRLLRKALVLICLLPALRYGNGSVFAQTPPIPLPLQEQEILFLPLVVGPSYVSQRDVAVVPVVGPPVSRPAPYNADLNLALRSFSPASAPLTLVDYGGETDGDPPQLATLLNPSRIPALVATYRVFDWNWDCGPDGCRGNPIEWPPVTLLGLGAENGEPIYLPARRAEMYAGGYIAMVLYADPTRLTLKYGREDSPASGYVVHLENLAVDPAIVRRYEEMDRAGRAELPALCNGDLLGWAASSEVMVAVRDTGCFMDPRSRKDWWQGWGE